MARAGAGDEESGIGRRQLHETCAEFRTDFVIRLADAGADGGGDALRAARQAVSIAATCGFDHAAKRALPAGMRCADDARFGIGEQHRRAICGKNAERDAGDIRRHGVGLRRSPTFHGAVT